MLLGIIMRRLLGTCGASAGSPRTRFARRRGDTITHTLCAPLSRVAIARAAPGRSSTRRRSSSRCSLQQARANISWCSGWCVRLERVLGTPVHQESSRAVVLAASAAMPAPRAGMLVHLDTMCEPAGSCAAWSARHSSGGAGAVTTPFARASEPALRPWTGTPALAFSVYL